MVPQIFGIENEAAEIAAYNRAAKMDPTPNNLGHLLATDSDDLLNDSPGFWLVLELYGPAAHLVLPLELAERGRYRLAFPQFAVANENRPIATARKDGPA